MKEKIENGCAFALSVIGSLLVVAMAFGLLSVSISLTSGIACFAGAVLLLHPAA